MEADKESGLFQCTFWNAMYFISNGRKLYSLFYYERHKESGINFHLDRPPGEIQIRSSIQALPGLSLVPSGIQLGVYSLRAWVDTYCQPWGCVGSSFVHANPLCCSLLFSFISCSSEDCLLLPRPHPYTSSPDLTSTYSSRSHSHQVCLHTSL